MDRLDAIMAEIRKRTGDAESAPASTSPGDTGTAAPPKPGPLSGARTPSASAADRARVRRRKQLIVVAATIVGLAVLMPTIISGVQGGIAQAKASAAAAPTPSPTIVATTPNATAQSAVGTTDAPTATTANRDGLAGADGGASPQTGRTPGATRSAAPSDWSPIVHALDAARAHALIARDPALLTKVDAPASTAMARDRATITALRRDRLRVTAVPLRVLSVQELAVSLGSTPARAVLIVEDVLSGYQLLADDGSASRRVEARQRARWRVELVLVPGQGWRYSDVVSAASPRSP